MNGVSSNRTVPTLVCNGNKYETNAEKAELFADTFAQVSSDSNYTDEFNKQKTTTLRDQQCFNRINCRPTSGQTSDLNDRSHYTNCNPQSAERRRMQLLARTE